MWEAYGLENEDFLWTGTGFFGGIGGYQKAPCGAVSASAICLGLRHRCPADDEEKVRQAKWNVSQKAGKIVGNFAEKFGTIICQDLLGLISPTARQPGGFSSRARAKISATAMSSSS
jgi:C_GCAxxG_C_C family probable redox protein